MPSSPAATEFRATAGAAEAADWQDSFTLLMVFPAEPRVHFLGDTTVLVTRKFQWWVVRQVGGFIPVDKQRRADQNLFQHVDRCLQRGGVVALYPEAHTVRGRA